MFTTLIRIVYSIVAIVFNIITLVYNIIAIVYNIIATVFFYIKGRYKTIRPTRAMESKLFGRRTQHAMATRYELNKQLRHL